MVLNECPLCGSSDLRPILHTQDYSISGENFEIHQCQNCSFTFTNPQPSPEEIGRYYQSENYISHSEKTSGIIGPLYRFIQKINLKSKFRIVDKYVPRGTWVDYGAGAGAFVKYSRTKGVDAIGFEPNKTALKSAKAKEALVKPLEEFEQIKNKSVDAITLWHVLEHIHNFKEILTHLATKLNETGSLIIALPNFRSFDAEKYRHFWAAYDVPRHLWHFDEKTIEKIGNQSGLELLDIHPQIFDSFYVSMLSAKYSNTSMLRAILTGMRSNLKGFMKQRPYSSQIYVFRKKPT